jgi:hypothetical protein
VTHIRYPEWRWERLPNVHIVQTPGPSQSREATDDDPPYEPPKQRLGFAPPPVDEPLTWDGDQS